MKKAIAKTVDDYLAPLPSDVRAALEKLRKTVKAMVPDAEEVISYGMPGFRYRGRALVWFAGFRDHCSFFPGGVLAELKQDLAGFRTAKGTIHFTPDKPLPAALIKKLVKARLKVNEEISAKKR
ncbi:MAG TPA: DUF1801 domain-containing protein [Spirochaetia bacterium]|nr:DUF1801 domain-containing protein [Spirochaetia bacterium]